MRDGLPGVVFLVVSFPTNFVKISPYFSITNLAVKILTATNCFGIHCIDPSVCFENAFRTGSKYDVDVLTASLPFP